jgi:pyruvate/2-oxoglutarate dehydrogenase complex dihydrolipoamide dehydrogenase (E3) component
VCIIERGVTRDALGNRIGAGVGGTCVNVGCVPKKLMFMAAAHREMFHGSAATGEGFGVTVGKVKFDWAGLKVRRDAYVKRLNTVYEGGWTKAGIDVKMGMATLTAPNRVKVALVGGGEEEIEAKNVLVAVGGCVN